LRLLQKVNNFNQLLFGLVHPGDIIEGDNQILQDINSGFVFAKGHKTRLPSRHSLHEKVSDSEKYKYRDDPGQQAAEKGG
jgi:hypothetical protein